MIDECNDSGVPEITVIDRYDNNSLRDVILVLFDDEGREHQVWFEMSGEDDLTVTDHKCPTRSLTADDIETNEQIRAQAESIVAERGYARSLRRVTHQESDV